MSLVCREQSRMQPLAAAPPSLVRSSRSQRGKSWGTAGEAGWRATGGPMGVGSRTTNIDVCVTSARALAQCCKQPTQSCVPRYGATAVAGVFDRGPRGRGRRVRRVRRSGDGQRRMRSRGAEQMMAGTGCNAMPRRRRRRAAPRLRRQTAPRDGPAVDRWPDVGRGVQECTSGMR